MIARTAFACAVLFGVNGYARAQSSMPPQPLKQQQFCGILQSYSDAGAKFRDSVGKMNALQQAQARPPSSDAYDQEVIALLGKSGSFDKWSGQLQVLVAGDRAILLFGFACAVHSGGFEQDIGFAFDNVDPGILREPKLMALPSDYRGEPVSSPLMIKIAKEMGPGLTVPALATGSLYYQTKGGPAGFADPGLTVNPIIDNFAQHVLLARFTDITFPPRSGP